MLSRKSFALVLFTIFVAAANTCVEARTTWQQHHPARAQVNSRFAHQNERIHSELKHGEISSSRASWLHHEDHQISGRERAAANQSDGHISGGEQRALNRQENEVSSEIGH